MTHWGGGLLPLIKNGIKKIPNLPSSVSDLYWNSKSHLTFDIILPTISLGEGAAAGQLRPLGTPTSDATVFYLFLLYFMRFSTFRLRGIEITG